MSPLMALNGHHNRAAEMSVFGGRADIDQHAADVMSAQTNTFSALNSAFGSY
jgi:hypothetical protein